MIRGVARLLVALAGCSSASGGAGTDTGGATGTGTASTTSGGSVPSTSVGDEGGSTGGPEKEPHPDVWFRTAQRVCVALYDSAPKCSAFADEADCIVQWTTYLHDLAALVDADDSGLIVDEACASRFALEAEAMGSSTGVEYYTGLWSSECDPSCRLIHGVKQEGEPCVALGGFAGLHALQLGWLLMEPISDCAPGTYCAIEDGSQNGLREGTCAPNCAARPGLGEGCTPKSKAAGANAGFTYPPTAAPPNSMGWSATALPCQAGLWCDPGTRTCGPAPAPMDECVMDQCPNAMACVYPRNVAQPLWCVALTEDGSCDDQLVPGTPDPSICASAFCTADLKCVPPVPEICKYAGPPVLPDVYDCDPAHQYCGRPYAD